MFSMVNFENANPRSTSWRRLKRPSRQSRFRSDQALVPPTVVPDWSAFTMHEGWIDFFYRNIEQPQWNPLLAFIHETTERFFPSPTSEMPGNLFDDLPPEDLQPRAHGRKTRTAPAATINISARS